MAEIKIRYYPSSDLSISLAGLASDTNLLTGVESDAVNNQSARYLDYLLSGKITTGTSPTVNTEIRIYVAGLLNDGAFPDVLDGTGSAETLTSANVRDAALRLAAVLIVSASSNVAYFFGPVSVAALFGGQMPSKFVVFVTHNTAVNLNATAGNHFISLVPITETIE